MKTPYMAPLKNALMLLLGITAFASCVPDPIDIELPGHKPKLSIVSQVIPDNYMVVMVTRSFNSIAPPEAQNRDSAALARLIVENAYVTVSFAGRTEKLEYVGNGIYVSVNTLQYYNQQYTLYVKDPATGEEITATSTMLPMVEFDSIKPVREINGADTSIFVEYSFTDPPGDNYYAVTYSSYKKGGGLAKPAQLFEQKPNTFTIHSDKLFTDGHFKMKQQLGMKAGDTVAVSLINITEDYYKYLAVYQKSGKLFNQLTGEPIDFPTNVKNGFGFFTTHNPDVRILEL